ncbi:MAG: NAD-dependent epimerase/dehydratase family protein [Pseudomonadota bacterium]
MAIMILGAGGFVGSSVARHCIAQGHRTICVSRTPIAEEKGALVWVRGDRTANDGADIGSLLKTHACTTLIDMIGYSPGETASLLHQIDGVSVRYVCISSGDVYRNFGLLHRLETGAPIAGMLDERAALRTSRYPYRLSTPRAMGDPQKWMDDYDKILVEALVQEFRSDWTICRLPMVYGPGDPQRRFGWAYAPMRNQDDKIELPADWLDWTVTYGYVETVGAAIVHAATHPAAARRVFNITEDDVPVSHGVWVHRLAERLGWSGDIVRVADSNHPIAQATAAIDLSVDLKVSGAVFRRETGFKPPYSIEDGLQSLIAG